MKKENFNQEANPYKYDKLAKIPSWIKIFLLKYWAAGAAFFLGGMGSSGFIEPGTIAGGEKMLVFFILLLAIMMEYLIKHLIFLMKNSKNNTFKYNMVNKKGVLSFLLNLVYAGVCALPIMFLGSWLVYLDVNDIFHMPNIFGDSYGWGLDPFFVGFIYILEDALFVSIKNLIVYIHTRRKYNIQSSMEV